MPASPCMLQACPRLTSQVVDEMTAAAAATNITWHLHTMANATVTGDGTSVTLQLGGTTATLALLASNTDCTFAGGFVTTPLTLAPPQYSTTGITRITLVSPAPASCSRIAVAIGLGTQALAFDATIQPLSAWGQVGPW